MNVTNSPIKRQIKRLQEASSSPTEKISRTVVAQHSQRFSSAEVGSSCYTKKKVRLRYSEMVEVSSASIAWAVRGLSGVQ